MARKPAKKRQNPTTNATRNRKETFETVRNAALIGKAEFPDQIDYYDPHSKDFV